jgi:L-erythro-3,5-diaminohexanoate dehydrogenase
MEHEWDFYGLARVVGQEGVLPQQAERLDPSLPIRASELLIDVESLNIDAASFRQLKEEVGSSAERLGARVEDIVRARGKMHNPATGSGGMLIGRVREVGAQHPAHKTLSSGDRVATLVSLTLTPLRIDAVKAVHPSIDRVDVQGHAILFASGLYAKLPTDLPDALSLAALDVCGAPALIARYVRPGMSVAILGAGKSGALCLAQARRNLEGRGRLLALDVSPTALDVLREMDLCDEGLTVNATDAVSVLDTVSRATVGKLCDLVVNCASVPDTEMATILSTRAGGTAIFFSMATRFTAAALGAEGVGKDITMVIGTGYVPGHADLTLDLLRTSPKLRELFERRYR